MTIADVLEKAADLIEPEWAWTQGAFSRDNDGEADEDLVAREPVCFCALGAIASVLGFNPASPWSMNPAALTAERALAALVPIGDVASWNDAPERTQEEVVAKLREAAKRAREAMS